MEQLVVRLGTNLQDPVHWVVWSATEQDVIASGELPGANALETLSERTSLRKALVLVPGADVRLCSVTMPGKVSRKLQNAIPFMLEDELAEDINELFFAMGPSQGNEQAVAIVSHRQMAKWLDWLNEAGLTAEAIIPDMLALPAPQDNEWITLALGNDLLIRQGNWQAMQGDQTFLTSVLAFQAKAQPEPVPVKALTDVELHAVPNINLTVDNADVPAMGVLAKHLSRTAFNLLQGSYKPKKQHNQLWQVWRLPLMLLAAVVILTLGDRALKLNQLKAQNAALTAQIDALVQQGFPDIGTYRNVRLKIQQEMRRLEQSGDGSSLLVMLSQLNNAFATSKVTPQTLRFDANRTEIRMQALANDFNALDAFKRSAEAAGFTVEQGAINNRDNTVIGTMNIKGAS